MFTNPVYKQALKNLVFLVASIALTGATKGLWLGVMTLMGVSWAFSGKTGRALSVYTFIIFMVVVNPILLPAGRFFSLFVRVGPLIIGLVLMLKGLSYKGQSRVPLGMLTGYLCVAFFSSIDGWAPYISYLKLINFFVFLLGFWFGLHTLSRDFLEMQYLRATFLALSAFLILGSLALIPFPGISTLSGLELALREGNVEAVNEAMKYADMSMPLFCGVTKQSQALAILASSVTVWLIADMLYVEQKFEKMHLYMILIALPLIYMTRSRIGLFTLVVGVFMVTVNLSHKIRLPNFVKKHLWSGIYTLMILGFAVVCISEIRNQSITRWLRKTDDVKGDTRSLSEAVTSSRQGLIDQSMYDYRRNPMFGKGFQVSEQMAYTVARSRSSFILSAPIEKGLLPVMVLGETGIVGSIVFGLFLISFYSNCKKNNLHVTAAMFTVLLASNMGEATFFSPGGSGGILWSVSVIGGYCIDTLLGHLKEAERQLMLFGFDGNGNPEYNDGNPEYSEYD